MSASWYFRDVEALRRVPWTQNGKYAVEEAKYVGETLHIEIAELVGVQDGCAVRTGIVTPSGAVYCVPMSANIELNVGDAVTIKWERSHVPWWRLVT